VGNAGTGPEPSWGPEPPGGGVNSPLKPDPREEYRPGMRRPRAAVEAVVYHTLRSLFGTAARVYYGRLTMRHPERIPSRGPLLIAANHPASLTDVLVLGAMLPRRAHFVAYSGLFQPRLLGLVLRLAGTVPVYRSQEGPEHMHRNAEMFRACNDTFRDGGAVLIFPEGTSMSDRRVERLRTGAARMALAYEFAEDRGEPLTLLPIGIHFEDRTRFQSRATVSVGRPIELPPLRALHDRDPQLAVRELTDRLQVALEKLILNIRSMEFDRLVRDAQEIYLADLRERMPGCSELALARGIADAAEFLREHDREHLHRLWLAVNAYQRKLRALDVRDRALREVTEASRATGLMTRAALGAVPALLGAAVHVVPYQLSGTLGSWFSSDPTRIAFARIVTGVVLFPASYGAIAWFLWRVEHWSEPAVLIGLASCVPLGLFSLGYFRWLGRERQRLRVVMLAGMRRRMVARLRVERRLLVQLLDRAGELYEAWRAVDREGPGHAG